MCIYSALFEQYSSSSILHLIEFPWKYDENDPQCVELKAVLARQIEKLAAFVIEANQKL